MKAEQTTGSVTIVAGTMLVLLSFLFPGRVFGLDGRYGSSSTGIASISVYVPPVFKKKLDAKSAVSLEGISCFWSNVSGLNFDVGLSVKGEKAPILRLTSLVPATNQDIECPALPAKISRFAEEWVNKKRSSAHSSNQLLVMVSPSL